MVRPHPALGSRTVLAGALLLGALIVTPAPAWPQESSLAESPYFASPIAESPFFLRVEGLRWYFLWGADKVPTGADLTIGYRGRRLFPGVDTIIQTTVGGGYEGLKTYRDVDYRPNVQIPISAAAGHNRRLEFNSPNLQWELGVLQGILRSPDRNQDQGRNLLEAFAFYRGRYDLYLGGRYYQGTEESRVATIEAYHEWWKEHYAGTDAGGIFGTSFLFGLDWNGLQQDPRSRAWEGYYGEASMEASPWIPGVPGASDFWRVSASALGFHTLWEQRPEARGTGLTIYLGDRFSVDYADARRAMPLYVMESFGGRRLRSGLTEDGVRGFESRAWDTQLKIVNNVELRFNLPPPFDFRGIRHDPAPGFLLFADLGYGASYWGDPSDTPGSLLGSTGVGLYLDLFGIVDAVGTVGVPVIGSRLDGRPMQLDLSFGLHF
jgi:hypothetical protein